MKVLLLGGTGTLSTTVLRCALKKGYDITIMNRGSKNNLLPKEITSIICDFYNTEDVRQNFHSSNFDVVVDFLSRKPHDIERIYPIFKDLCKQYIFISSACVYRRGEGDFPIKETSPKPNPDWDYNIQKYEAEQKLMLLAKTSNSFYTIIRPYITYNDERIPLGIVPAYKYHRTIIERIRSGKPWFIWDGGNSLSTLTYADELAVGVVGLFLNEKAKNTDFHITSDYVYSQKRIVKLLFEKLKMPQNIVEFSSEEIAENLPEYKGMLLGDRSLNAIFDNSKIKDAVPELVFNVSLEQGLDKILAYWNDLSTFDYDYKFDARVDKLIGKKNNSVGFVKYPHSSANSKKTYLINRYLPTKWATLAMRHLV